MRGRGVFDPRCVKCNTVSNLNVICATQLTLLPSIPHLDCAGHITRYGHPTFIANDCFAQDICGGAEATQAWKKDKNYNGQESFIHPDSVHTFYHLTTSGFKEAFRSPGEVVALRCDIPLQIMLLHGRGQGAFTMRHWHLVQDEIHAMAFELHPLPPDEQQRTTLCRDISQSWQVGAEVGGEHEEHAAVSLFDAQKLCENYMGVGEESMAGPTAHRPNVMQHLATSCNALQNAATHSSSQQYNALESNVTGHPLDETDVGDGFDEAIDAFHQSPLDTFLHLLDNAPWTLEPSSLALEHTSHEEWDVERDEARKVDLETVRDLLRPQRISKRARSVILEM